MERLANHPRTILGAGLLLAAICLTVSIVESSLCGMIFAALITLGVTQYVGTSVFFSTIENLTVQDVMERDVQTLLLAQTLKNALNSDLPLNQRYFPVICGDQIFGVLSRSCLEGALLQGKGDTYVAEVMSRQLVFVRPDESLKVALERSHVSQDNTILVGDSDHLLGMLTLESIQRRLSRSFSLKAF